MTSSLPFVRLYPSGELTEEEWALLQVHLAYCDSCRKAFEQYKYLGAEILPAMAAADVEDRPAPSFSLEDAEQRLMSAGLRLNLRAQSKTLGQNDTGRFRRLRLPRPWPELDGSGYTAARESKARRRSLPLHLRLNPR